MIKERSARSIFRDYKMAFILCNPSLRNVTLGLQLEGFSVTAGMASPTDVLGKSWAQLTQAVVCGHWVNSTA